MAVLEVVSPVGLAAERVSAPDFPGIHHSSKLVDLVLLVYTGPAKCNCRHLAQLTIKARSLLPLRFLTPDTHIVPHAAELLLAKIAQELLVELLNLLLVTDAGLNEKGPYHLAGHVRILIKVFPAFCPGGDFKRIGGVLHLLK